MAGPTMILGIGKSFSEIINYELIRGNVIWRFGVVLIIVFAALAAGRTVQFMFNSYAQRISKKKGERPLGLVFKAIANPAYVAVFALGFFFCKLPLVFNDETGIRIAINSTWASIASVVGAIAVAYALYRLVDVIEYYLNRVVGRTATKMDDMLVPAIRKAMRVTIAIVAALLISENILGPDRVRTLIATAGVGGIAVALAAKDTIANFFGSITIFADRPFQMGDTLKIDDDWATVEEVGFRSTKVRTFYGHLLTIPNSNMANSKIENVSKRPYIRRVSNITITYDSGHSKAEKAVDIIKDVLGGVPEASGDSERPPRVYFSEFNDWSLNIYMSYWVQPPDYWLYYEVNERVNLEIMKRFEAEGIEFAFPSQTLYVKKDD